MTDWHAPHFFTPSHASRGGSEWGAFDLPVYTRYPLPTSPCLQGEESNEASDD